MSADRPTEHTTPPAIDDETSDVAPADVQPSTPAPRRPRVLAVLVGLFCLAVAGFTFAIELGNVMIDWSTSGPYLVIGSGLVIAVVGALGMIGSRRT